MLSYYRPPFRWWSFLIIAVIAMVTAFHFRADEVPVTPEATAPAGVFTATDTQWNNLSFATIEQQPFHTIVETDGKIASDDDTTTQVFSPYAGRVIKIFAKAGDHVERGDPLMAMASPDFASAHAQLKLATENEKRQHALYLAKTGALKDWLQSQADLEIAKGNSQAAEMEHDALRERLRNAGKGEDEIAALDAQAVVTAPISGTVLERQVGLGQYINSAAGGAANPVFAIGNLSTVWLLANLREADASLIAAGDALSVQVPAYPHRTFDAKVTYVAPMLDPATHRLPVRAEISNADGALKPEMYAGFSISADAGAASFPAVPEDAVIYEGESAHVWVANKEKKQIGLRAITPGRSEKGKVEVVDGLKPGEVVVTSGSVFIDRAARGDDAGAPKEPDGSHNAGGG